MPQKIQKALVRNFTDQISILHLDSRGELHATFPQDMPTMIRLELIEASKKFLDEVKEIILSQDKSVN